MKKYIALISLCLLGFTTACQKLDEPELSDNNTLSSIECVVIMEEKVGVTGKPDDERQIFQGTIAPNGIITFANINTLTADQKKRARFVAIIPQTATLVEKDGADNIIGNGIGGIRTISKKTYYFYVTAANGAEKKYTLSFN